MMVRLIGVTDDVTAARITASAHDPALKGLTIVTSHGLAAILAKPFVTGWRDGNARATLIRRLTEDQKRMEALIRLGPLLPAVNEAELGGEAEAADLLLASADTLAETLRLSGMLVQFQIRIDWNPDAMLRLHAGDAGLAILFQQYGDSRDGKGAAVADFMSEMRKHLAETYRAKVANAARDVVLMPGEGPDAVVNIVALIDRAEEAALDRAVEWIDASAPDALKIAYTGPLPPVSFAGLVVEKPTDVAAARRLLGLGRTGSGLAIREAYLSRVRAIHPDTAQTEPVGVAKPHLTELKDAYTLLSRIDAVQSSTGRIPPLVSIRREGDIARHA